MRSISTSIRSCSLLLATALISTSSQPALAAFDDITPRRIAAASTPNVSSPCSQGEANCNDVRSQYHLDKKLVAGIVIGASLLSSILLCLLWLCFFRASKSKIQPSNGRAQPSRVEPPADGRSWSRAFSSLRFAIRKARGSGNSACAIDYTLLKAATGNFSTANLVGSGGSGCVYKAQICDGIFAAVKQLNQHTAAVQYKLQRGFQTEVELMSRIRHPNLVALLGYSIHPEKHDHLLVYELILNGSLEDHLHGPSQGSHLNWNLRMKVALDAARGLEHLHEKCNPPIIHRDFKSSNILLDASFNAKVSDFGLAILSSDVSDEKSLELQGTFGYVAPEYLLDGNLSEKSDVYAFGVVLLELITGRKPIDMTMPIGCQSLVTWATPQLKERAKLKNLLDPNLQEESVDLKHMHQVAAIAALCIQSEPSYRPLITDVVKSLVPLVPSALGGAMHNITMPRSATLTEEAPEVSYIFQGKGSFSFTHDDEDLRSLSFSEYTMSPWLDGIQDPLNTHSQSARMAEDFRWC